MEGNHHNFPNYLDVVMIVYTMLMAVIAAFGYVNYGSDVQQIIGKH